ncbi:MAG: mRNA surveillance protein pelota [Nanoarchaeota archaeon]
MKIIHQDLKHGIVKVLVQNLDDLWYLSAIIDPGDSVRGETERKVKIGDVEAGSAKAVRKTFHVTLEVAKVDFSDYANILRVSGVITEGPEDIPRGVFQTIDVQPSAIVQIIKKEWLSFQLEKLKESTAARQLKILVVVFDREEALFGLLKTQGYDLLTRIKGDVRKKAIEEKKAESFYQEIVRLIQEYVKRYSLENVVVASPSFWKEYLMKEMPKELVPKITLAACSDVNETVINEVVRRPELRKLLEADRTSKEDSLVEELLAAVSKDMAAYGLKDVAEKTHEGAISQLVLTDKCIQKARQKNQYREVESVMRKVEAAKGKVNIISTHDAVRKVDSLGGIAGILRWKR